MMGIIQYTDDYDAFYPRSRMGGPPNHCMSWDDYIDPYMSGSMPYSVAHGENPSPIPDWAELLQCGLDDVPRVSSASHFNRTFTLNGHKGGGSPRVFAYDDDQKSSRTATVTQPTETIAMVEQAKSHNEGFNGGNCIIHWGTTNPTECTTGVQLTGGVQYNANHHQNGFRNIIGWLDGHTSLTFMPSTRDNSDWLWMAVKP
jgi:hypothetical protein